MNIKIYFVIFIFIVAMQIKFSKAENHCSKSAVMNIIMEQCSRQKRNAQYYSNNHEEIIFNSNLESQNKHHRNYKQLQRIVMEKSRVGRYLFQVTEDYEKLPKKSLSNDDMDEILEFVRRTPRSYRSKDEIIQAVAICCQDIDSCRKNKSIITCP